MAGVKISLYSRPSPKTANVDFCFQNAIEDQLKLMLKGNSTTYFLKNKLNPFLEIKIKYVHQTGHNKCNKRRKKIIFLKI
jgi:hypothetical protein